MASPGGIGPNLSPAMAAYYGVAPRKSLPSWAEGYDLDQAADEIGRALDAQGVELADVKHLIVCDWDWTLAQTKFEAQQVRDSNGALLHENGKPVRIGLGNSDAASDLFELEAARGERLRPDFSEFNNVAAATPIIGQTAEALRQSTDARIGKTARIISTARSTDSAVRDIRAVTRQNGVPIDAILAMNNVDYTKRMAFPDNAKTSHKKALTLLALTRAYEKRGARLQSITVFDDTDDNLRDCILATQATPSQARYEFYDVVYTAKRTAEHRLVARSGEQPGSLESPNARRLTDVDIFDYKSADAPSDPKWKKP